MSELRQAREVLNLSIRDLAERAGVAPMTVQRAERGLPIRPSSRRKLAEVLGGQQPRCCCPCHKGLA